MGARIRWILSLCAYIIVLSPMKDKASFNTERVKLEMMNLHNLRSNGSDKSLTKGDHKALDTNILNEAIGPDQHHASDDEDSDLSDQSSKHDHHHQYSYTNQMIYDSIGASFHLDIFFRQLISHLFPPLAYLLVNFRAQGFMTMNFGYFFFNIASQFMLYVAFVAFFMSSAEEQKQLAGMPYITVRFHILYPENFTFLLPVICWLCCK